MLLGILFALFFLVLCSVVGNEVATAIYNREFSALAVTYFISLIVFAWIFEWLLLMVAVGYFTTALAIAIPFGFEMHWTILSGPLLFTAIAGIVSYTWQNR